MPGVFDPEKALKREAPRVHETGNILQHAVVSTGNALESFSKCDIVVEDSFAVPGQEHAFLETENGLAWREPDGRIVMIVSTQAPFRDRFEIAHALGLEVDAIRVISPYLGGGFGGKDGATVQCLLALAALHAGGRPVKMCWEREESFIAGYKRHPVRMRYRLGAMRDGTLHALQCGLVYDTGPYAHLGAEVMALGMEHAGGPYRIPNTFIEGWCVYTNNPISGAMRGFGVCQVSSGIERMLDLLASKLGITRLDIRLKNALRLGDKNCVGVTLVHSTGIVPCLERLHSLWIESGRWKGAAGPFKRRGIGIAAVSNAMGYGRGLPDSAIAKVELRGKEKFASMGVLPTWDRATQALLSRWREKFCARMPHAWNSYSPTRTGPTLQALRLRAERRRLWRRRSRHERAKGEAPASGRHRLSADEALGFTLLPKVRHLPSGREVRVEPFGRAVPKPTGL